MNQRTFEELISCIANNNKNALDEFYQIYGKTIFGVAFSVCKQKSDADEVVDDVLVKIWNSALNLHDIKDPKAWLYRVTFNFSINKINSRQEADRIEDTPVTEINYDRVIDELTFYEIIAGLKDIEQQILCFKFIEDLTFSDIAKVLGKPSDTVAYEYYSALKKLKKHLDKFL